MDTVGCFDGGGRGRRRRRHRRRSSERMDVRYWIVLDL